MLVISIACNTKAGDFSGPLLKLLESSEIPSALVYTCYC